MQREPSISYSNPNFGVYYFPGGVLLDGRTSSSSSCRYGFNGMEADDEVKGGGNHLDFGARCYDSRIGRFLSIDPKADNYPFMSPYCYAANSPIFFIDENGEGPIHPLTMSRTFVTVFSVANWEMLIYNSLPLYLVKDGPKKDMRDWNLWRSAKNNQDAFEDPGNGNPGYEKRKFNGTYSSKLRKEIDGPLHSTGDLLDQASRSRNKITTYQNFRSMARGAMTGNYIYGEQGWSDYTITTVVDGIITEEAIFEQDKSGVWNLVEKIEYISIKELEKEKQFFMSQSSGPGSSSGTDLYDVLRVWEVIVSKTNYNEDGTYETNFETVTVKKVVDTIEVKTGEEP